MLQTQVSVCQNRLERVSCFKRWTGWKRLSTALAGKQAVNRALSSQNQTVPLQLFLQGTDADLSEKAVHVSHGVNVRHKICAKGHVKKAYQDLHYILEIEYFASAEGYIPYPTAPNI